MRTLKTQRDLARQFGENSRASIIDEVQPLLDGLVVDTTELAWSEHHTVAEGKRFRVRACYTPERGGFLGLTVHDRDGATPLDKLAGEVLDGILLYAHAKGSEESAAATEFQYVHANMIGVPPGIYTLQVL